MASSTSPGTEKVVNSTIRLWDQEERDQIQSALEKKMASVDVSNRQGPGGSQLSYVETWKAIELANKTFGFNGWSSSIMELHIDFLEQGSGGKWSIGLSAIVRVTLKDGTFHEDVGYACLEQKNKGQLIEFAKKSAVSDGLKRALRHFGNALGLSVYDKEHIKSMRKIVKPAASGAGSSAAKTTPASAIPAPSTTPAPVVHSAPPPPPPAVGQRPFQQPPPNKFSPQQPQQGKPPSPATSPAVSGSGQFGRPQSNFGKAPASAAMPPPPQQPALDFSSMDDSFFADYVEEQAPAAPKPVTPSPPTNLGAPQKRKQFGSSATAQQQDPSATDPKRPKT